MTVPVEFFIEAYQESLGAEGAQKVVADALREAGLVGRKTVSSEEAQDILTILKSKDGFVRFVATCLSLRMIWIK